MRRTPSELAACRAATQSTAAAGPYAVQAKPHGHGDLHALLHASGGGSSGGNPTAGALPLRREGAAAAREGAALKLVRIRGKVSEL